MAMSDCRYVRTEEGYTNYQEAHSRKDLVDLRILLWSSTKSIDVKIYTRNPDELLLTEDR